MIVFLNFAPLEYLGGAERKMYELFTEANKYERSTMITVDTKIANVYSKIVLGIKFEDRDTDTLKFKDKENIKIHLVDFLPFSEGYRNIKKIFQSSRIIYFKADITEILVLLYFSNLKIFSKAVAGIRSPWLYPKPTSFFDILHNMIYSSLFMKLLMRRMKRVHVLSKNNKFFFTKRWKLKNVIEIPNYYDESSISHIANPNPTKKLKIIFVGELISRKGIDILLKIIKVSPRNYSYVVVGKGPYSKKINSLSRKFENLKYLGYLEKKQLDEAYRSCDVLLFPSRAEGFGGVILEAISHGLKVLNSSYIIVGLPRYIEYSSPRENVDSYLKLLSKIYQEKLLGKSRKKEIVGYFNKHFSRKVIMPRLLQSVLEVKK